jgi:hypothetical protein
MIPSASGLRMCDVLAFYNAHPRDHDDLRTHVQTLRRNDPQVRHRLRLQEQDPGGFSGGHGPPVRPPCCTFGFYWTSEIPGLHLSVRFA